MDKAGEQSWRSTRCDKNLGVGDEVMQVSIKRKYSPLLVMHMVRRVRQPLSAVVSAMKGQIVRPKHVIARGVGQVVAVAADRKSLPVENIFLGHLYRQFACYAYREAQPAADEDGFNDVGEFGVKSF
jgi:hypothetical protein